MKVFLDTNIIIDALEGRENSSRPSLRLFDKILDKQVTGIICCKQLSDIYYITRNYFTLTERKELISLLMESLVVISDSKFFMAKALKSSIPDFEDAFLDEVALTVKDAYFVTKNIKHFVSSKNLVITPEQAVAFLDMQPSE